ncbi:hypothetical protein K2173_016480 [Erythroxylum novogranatense]|uniref:Uncharacterized protein n=1 Tax=Erythroxylum novogranatense TaxID=1862640 RepID=A0AAV8SGW3_9ROSI|nr:hypothetical protein K2173_016480 [Erythroxylum novogranatense]
MGFFDLNVPYETSEASKTARIKIVTKAMELGYSGIAYNRTMKGVMSDQDRCSIPLLSFSSLLSVAPSLASSVNFHRDLHGVPRVSPFRQYTRLTVCVDSPAQSHVLNSGNPVLKSYDLVAVRPLNQNAFDHACEKAEVHIISIDFAEKLPFRLKPHMIKTALERGVYFEIMYSDLIVDVQVRRQMIPNAKLLVDWTRGKSLILSSGASSVNELRGPYDVANLTSLLGLPMDRAKAAISQNCRNLVTNALKKKNFYKEAIRVELVPSNKMSDSEDPSSADWLKWDPISSGEGDLLLDDMARAFSETTQSTETVKVVDFTPTIDNLPSNSGASVAATKAIEAPVTISGESLKADGFHLCGIDKTSLDNAQTNSASAYEKSRWLGLSNDAANALSHYDQIRSPTKSTVETMKYLTDSNILSPLDGKERQGHQLEEPIVRSESYLTLPNEHLTCQMSDTSAFGTNLNGFCVADAKTDNVLDNSNHHAHPVGMKSKDFDEVLGAQDVLVGDRIEMDMDEQESKSSTENSLGIGQLREAGDHIQLNLTSDKRIEGPKVDHIPVHDFAHDRVVEDADLVHEPDLACSDDRKFEGCPSVANQEAQMEILMEHQGHDSADNEETLVLSGDTKRTESRDNSFAGSFLPQEELLTEEIKPEVASRSVHLTSVSSPSGTSSIGFCPFSFMFLTLTNFCFLKECHWGLRRQNIFLLDTGKCKTSLRMSRRPLVFPLKRFLNPVSFKRKAKRFRHKAKTA